MLAGLARALGGAVRAVAWTAVAASVLALVVLGLGPHSGRYRTATVLSASMRPAIPEGSVVLVTPLPATELRVGDVIMYRIPEGDHATVAHRVVEILEAGPQPVVRTKGDANAEPDAWLARLDGETLWRVRGAVPELGYVVHALRETWARWALVDVVPALLGVLWLWDIWRPRRAPAADARPSSAAAGT